MTEEKSDDFAGISRGGVVFLVIIMSLCHPWQALGELFRVVFRATKRALGYLVGFVLAPVLYLVLRLRTRDNTKGHTFEDYLHRTGAFEDD